MESKMTVFYSRGFEQCGAVECFEFAPHIEYGCRVDRFMRKSQLGTAEELIFRRSSTGLFFFLRNAMFPGFLDRLQAAYSSYSPESYRILHELIIEFKSNPGNVKFEEVDSIHRGKLQAQIDQLKSENIQLRRNSEFWKRMLAKHFKPMFIPLTKRWYDEFAAGRKNVEYRRAGRRWNPDVCFPGREVVLSCGYGKSRRMKGIIENSWVETDPTKFSDDFVSVFGFGENQLAIQIKVMED